MSTNQQIAEQTYDEVMALVQRERISQARQVIKEKRNLLAHSERLAKLARALELPVGLNITPPPEERDDLFASARWYRENRHEPQWRGLYVAVRKGKLVTTAPTREELRAQLRDQRGTLAGVSVFSL